MVGRRAGALLPACALLTLAAPARTQTPRPGVGMPWRPFRFDENYAYLRDSVRHGWWQPLKYIRLGGWSWLSFGGEVRAEYERLDHPAFGALPTDRGGYELARLMLHADWRLGSRLRLFGQLASAQETGRTGGARPTDVDTLDVRQAFA